jgi:phospholipase/lecithinase/hemolysin
LGIGNDLGALTVPLVAQIDRHLARFGRFGDGDLVFVWGGNNDLFLSFAAFADAAVQIIGRQRLGLISAAEADALLLEAQLAAQARMKTAAGELALAVRERILARGGRYVAVVTLPDFADIPFGAALAADPTTAPLVPVLSGLSAVFNTWLREGLAGQPVQVIDAWALFKRIKASPGDFGLLDVATPACDFAKQDAVLGRVLTSGRALFCNVTTGAPFDMLRDGADPSTWLFADDAHPTTGGHRVIAEEFARQLASWGWIR